MLVMGFMSGTSLDGVDAALLDTDGSRINGFGLTLFEGYSAQERAALEQATQDALHWNGYGEVPPSIASAAAVIESIHCRAARKLMEISGERPDLLGFHGQTLLHRPERKLSLQIGDPQVLADALGVAVVADMRQADLAGGGQGAPLVPAYHSALVEYLDLPRPVAFLNVGGVANLTFIGMGGELVAFDTGPGNGLIDQLVQARGAGNYDDDGRFAGAGKVQPDILEKLLQHEHFSGHGPKSLDRYDFPLDWAVPLSLEDAAATLTAFTADAVAMAVSSLPQAPEIWIICGGGSHNSTLMRALGDRLGDCRAADSLGLRGDFIEAEAMGFLAARSVKGLPLTFPGTTGIGEALTGGRLWRPNSPLSENMC
ncbi:anhydro-N-acetylmuramic acid kinase [Altererythrobacter indicus]|uniref:Anhydro-N-acetylmuramic acid kinase n=1 Tax=Altericroceibacterium indicum TaxID=374177 RepID=A0A845A881_9SPHN|nr:anhydro-N-acetylmuramic acid kinase [Altericroceibacterium indicum]MXP26582.1 anhydro-N-acetylmuramic acid kinase [Altericroceibacterium indicum]